MTAPKHHPRRLGFRDDSDDATQTSENVQDFGRWIFLQTVAKEAPAVLETLHAVSRETDVPSWAARWGLTDAWCLAYARATWRNGRAYPTTRTSWHDRDDQIGEWSDSEQPRRPRVLKDPIHFSWLVQFHCQPNGPTSYAALADRYDTNPQTVHEAVRTLATFLGLTLRVTRRGAPRKRPIS